MILRTQFRWLILCFAVALAPRLAVSEPLTLLTIGAGSALGSIGLFGAYEYFKCKLTECCDDRWIINNTTGLERVLSTKLYGQHLVMNTVISAIRSHVTNPNPNKALVLSFHGPTGCGKNYVSNLIRDHLFAKKSATKFAHWFVAGRDFPHANLAAQYRVSLQKWIEGNVTQCGRSLFVFDDVQLIGAGVLDAVKPYLDFHHQLHGVDFRKSIFIFLSDTGGRGIIQHSLENWQTGKERESIQLADMEAIIMRKAANEKGGLQYSDVVSSQLIDHYIPFLPLERSHVNLCICDYYASRNNGTVPDTEFMQKVLEELQWYPPGRNSVYSNSGCKRVSQKVDLHLMMQTLNAHSHSEL